MTPFHFSTLDLREIRAYLTDADDLQEMLTDETDDAEFVVVARVFPLMHSVASLWVLIGCITSMDPMEITVLANSKARMKEAKAQAKKITAAYDREAKRAEDETKQILKAKEAGEATWTKDE